MPLRRRCSPLSLVLPTLWTLVSHSGLAAQDTAHVVVVATTDVHGHVYHWDYVRDAEAPWGLTRAATVLDSLRRAHPGAVVLVDAGDLIQGSPFATLFATREPVTPHPVLEALNALGYDAATPGNHEFNWGLEVLHRALASAAFPIVSGNIARLSGDTLAFPSHVILARGDVRVGVTGFTTPGAMVWDRDHLQGRVVVQRILPRAEAVLRELAQADAALRLVVMHSGMDGPSSYDTTGVGAENVAARLAELPVKPHVVVVGHTHRRMTDSVIAGVHFIQPAPHARSLAVAHVWLAKTIGDCGLGIADCPAAAPTNPQSAIRNPQYEVVRITAEQISLAAVPPHADVTRRLAPWHERVRAWVNQPLAAVEGDWRARYARAQDTPVIDFVNEVQRRAAGAELSATAAFNPDAAFGPDSARLRHVMGVYPYENTLKAVRISGAALAAYLEQSAAYFRTYVPGAPVINEGIPGYNFDIVSGVEYVIDLTAPVGRRIRDLAYAGRPVQPSDTFTMALNNYRQGGGGGFAMLHALPVVYDRGESIRDLIVDALRTAGTVQAADYFRPSWRIVPEVAAQAVRRAFARGRQS